MYTWGIAGSDLIAEEYMNHLLRLNLPFKMARDTTGNLRKKFPMVFYYETIEELLNDESIDIIYISTYVDEHQNILMEALRKGHHVVCEKPMFLNALDVSKAYELARKKGLLIAEANTIFYMPMFEEIKRQIQEGMLGNLKMLRCEFGSLKEEDASSFIMNKNRGGGALYDIGIYALSACMDILGTDIKSVKSIVLPHEFGVDERWNILIQNSENQIASIELSIRNKLDKRFIIAGDKGYFDIINFPRGDKYEFVDSDMKKTYFKAGDSNHAVSYIIKDIEATLDKNEFEDTKMDLTYKVMQVLDLLREESSI